MKDAEDIEGDREGGARTLPMTIGAKRSAAIGSVLCLAAVIISLMPLFRWWGVPYLISISMADLVIMTGAIRGLRAGNPGDLINSRATSILKYGMFLSLAIFIGFAVLLG